MDRQEAPWITRETDQATHIQALDNTRGGGCLVLQKSQHVERHSNVTFTAHLHATAGIKEAPPLGWAAGLSIPSGNTSLTHGQIARRRTGTEEGLCQFKESASPAPCRKRLLAGRLCAVHIPHRLGLRHNHTRSGFRTDTTVKSLRQREGEEELFSESGPIHFLKM